MVEEAQALQGADELQACLQVVMSLIEAQEVVDKWGRYPTGTRFLLFWAEATRWNKTRQRLLALFLTSDSTLFAHSSQRERTTHVFFAVCNKNRMCGANISKFLPEC
jgi:hypothetical protein